MSGVLKEIFTDIILSKFYPDGSWLGELTSMDHMVDNNKINLAQVGANPEVIKDCTQFPITPTTRTDTGVEITLATFDTRPTHVSNVEEMETNYNKAESVLNQHIDTLREACAMSAAYNIAPDSNSADHPVLATTGNANSYGHKALTFDDLLKLRTAFNKKNFPMTNRVLVLCPEHEEDLLAEDKDRYNRMMTTGNVAGFKVYTFNGNLHYSTGGSKSAYGVTNTQPASFAFCKSEAMRAMGDIDSDVESRWAEYRGVLIACQVRFVAMPMRGKAVAAIYSANA
ncbi:MAG: hypothetical protein II815_02195 [Bacteroidales bacterium]|nr:hypothetical protein [Bacteroidales bacterium]